MDSSPSRRPFGTLLPLGLALAGLIAIGFLLLRSASPGEVLRPDPNGSLAPDGLATPPTVILDSGETVALPPVGGGVVMIASAGCLHCHAVLDRMAERLAEGETLPDALRLVVVEGLDQGREMIESHGVSLELAAPSGTIDDFAAPLGLRSVPLFLHYDASGTEIDRVTGAISGSELDLWMSRGRR